jgi:hypothetical protein
MFQNSQNALGDFMFIVTKYFESSKIYLKHTYELLEEQICKAFWKTLLLYLEEVLSITPVHYPYIFFLYSILIPQKNSITLGEK